MKQSPLVCLVLLMTLLASCSTMRVDLPAIASATGEQLSGKVVWHDLVTEDPAAARAFYGQLLGWEFRSLDGLDYTLILQNGLPVGGMVDARNFTTDGNVSQWVVVLSVDDIDGATESVKGQGGSILGGPVDVGARGQLALARDAQGAYFAMLQTRDGDPPDGEAAIGEFMWNELWTSDSQSADAFYQHVFGLQSSQHALADGSVYRYLGSQGQPRVAVLDSPVTDMAPTWVSYIRVADAHDITARVAALGGELLLPVQRNPIGGELAILKDPTGAGFIVQTWNKVQQEGTP